MKTHYRQREVRFFIQDGCLVRTVSGDGRTYTHRCSLEVFEIVAWLMAETPAEGSGVGIGPIASGENLPHTQVDVTLAFLQERGIIVHRHRHNYPASDSVHLDAMVEWHALRQELKPA